MLERRSEEVSSPGLGRAGSLRERFIATWERRRSEDWRSRRGDAREEVLRCSVAFMVAAAARECSEGRGETLDSRRVIGEPMATAIDRGCGVIGTGLLDCD